MYSLLKNIENKIEKKLNFLDIKAEKKIQESIKNRRFYYLTRADFQGRKIIFKVQIANYKKIQEEITELTDKNLKHEIVFLKNFQKPFLPLYLKSGLSPSPWLIYEYVEGEVQGKPFKLLPSLTSEENFRSLVSLISQIQKITYKNNLPLKKYGFRVYFNSYLKKIKLLRFPRKYLKNEEIGRVKEIFKEKRDLLDKKAFVLTHGDLHGENIIKKPEGQLVLVDWETVHFNNPAYDIAYLWLKGFFNPSWQGKFLNYFFNLHKEGEFKELFKIVVLHRIPNEIEYWAKQKNEKNIKILLQNFRKVLNEKV